MEENGCPGLQPRLELPTESQPHHAFHASHTILEVGVFQPSHSISADASRGAPLALTELQIHEQINKMVIGLNYYILG